LVLLSACSVRVSTEQEAEPAPAEVQSAPAIEYGEPDPGCNGDKYAALCSEFHGFYTMGVVASECPIGRNPYRTTDDGVHFATDRWLRCFSPSQFGGIACCPD